MNIALNPDTVYPPLGPYSQTVKVPRDAELLFVAGQVGMDAEGRLAEGPRKQAEQAFRNVVACLRAQGMRRRDLVKITVYLTDPRYIDDYRAARNKVLGEVRPTSALLIVQSLFTPDILVEVEAWAAKS